MILKNVMKNYSQNMRNFFENKNSNKAKENIENFEKQVNKNYVSNKKSSECIISASSIRERTISIANKVKHKISLMKENENTQHILSSNKSDMLRDRSNSSCLHTNTNQTIKSIQLIKGKPNHRYSAKYFSK